MRILAGDVGGTKTLLRSVGTEGSPPFEVRYESPAWKSFDDLLQQFVRQAGGTFDAACLAVAGPVYAGRAELTNLGWTIDERALATAFGIPRVSLINDFYAVALGVPLLSEHDLLSIHRGARDRSAPIAILGAGTGLGEAVVAPFGNVFHVIPTEGGHADFAPQDQEQTLLFLQLQERYGHVSWERLLSGMGLTSIYSFLGGPETDPADIATHAAAGDPRASRAFDLFVDIYGSEAGNMALRTLARGGVFLAGGIAAKNVPRFTDGRFVEAFLRKGRFRALLESVPVDLIINEEVGLLGAVEGARRLVL